MAKVVEDTVSRDLATPAPHQEYFDTRRTSVKEDTTRQPEALQKTYNDAYIHANEYYVGRVASHLLMSSNVHFLVLWYEFYPTDDTLKPR